jgi:hypothetical protein
MVSLLKGHDVPLKIWTGVLLINALIFAVKTIDGVCRNAHDLGCKRLPVSVV